MFSIVFLTFYLFGAILPTNASDYYSTRGNFGVGAQTMDYTNNRLAISRNSDDTIYIYEAGSSTIYKTITGIHKADVKTVAFNAAGTRIASAGRDYIMNIVTLAAPTWECKFVDLHGSMEQLVWLSDNVRVAGVTDAGTVYLWNTTSCATLVSRNITNQRFKSVIERTAGNQLWVANYESKIYRLSTTDLSDSGAAFTVATRRLVSLFVVPSTTYLGVCTEETFYLYNGLTLAYTLNHLASPTVRCRISRLYTVAATYAGWVQGYFVTATSGYRELFSVWKLQVSPSVKMWLVRVQPDDGRHGTLMAHTAQLMKYQFNTIEVVSSSEDSKYLQNSFVDTTTTSCDAGTIPSLRIFLTWMCTLCTDIVNNAACYSCTNDNDCSTCYANHYRNTSTNDCIRCPQTCYTCSSATVCTACHTNFVLSTGSCVACNLTNCVSCFISSSTVLCSWCLQGYYLVAIKGCQLCNQTMPNCQQCTSNTTCTVCKAGYKMLPSNNGCQPCNALMQGCLSCLTSTYCDRCDFVNYPYYRNPASTQRYCQPSCSSKCVTCSYTYDNCATCDVNRTRTLVNASVGYTCNCKANYMLDSSSSKCLICSDYVTNCQICTNQTHCTTCNVGFYIYANGTAGYRSCLACNYSCQTCTANSNYYDCATCNSTNNRVLVSSKCVCISQQYYEVANNAACLSCTAAINYCLTCFNSTFCLTCNVSFYTRSVSSGNQDCSACGSKCLTCSQNSNNCTSCYTAAQNRQFNLSVHSCDCLPSYFSTITNDICPKCSDYLGGCQLCTNDSVCSTCQNKYFFQIDNNGKTICSRCQSKCLTCSVWSHVCASCSATAFRQLNSSTNTCDCTAGYIDTAYGVCLKCNTTFAHCVSCNSSHCKSCQTGYALTDSQLECLNCSEVLIGCLSCVNGVCIQCDTVNNFVLSRTACVCNSGYYFIPANKSCLPYQIGSKVGRSFSLTTLFSESNDQVNLTTIFAVKQVIFPLGIQMSLKLWINDVEIPFRSNSTNITNITNNTSGYYTASQTSNNTIVILFTPSQSISKANVTLQFLENTTFDEKEYQPTKSLLVQYFSKTIYGISRSTTEIITFASYVESYVTIAVRYFATAMLMLGSMDIVIGLISLYHVFPLYLLTGINIPGQMEQVLKAMMPIHQSSLFVFPHSEQLFTDNEYSSNAFLGQYNLNNSLFHAKHIDLIFIGFTIAFYGILGQLFLSCMAQGRRYKMWHGKFVQRRYSTVVIAILSLMVSFVSAAVIDYFSRRYQPGYSVTYTVKQQYLIIGGAIFVSAVFFCFIFVHTSLIGLIRLQENVKTQDCYMGMSKIDTRCEQYVLSELLYWVFVPMTLLYLHTMALLIISILLVLWNISFYRHWILFPNKVVYFCRLFIQIGVLLFNLNFLVFYLAENFVQIQTRLLVVLGYLSLSGVVMAIALNFVLSIILIAQTIIRLCRTNNSMIQSLARIAQQKKQSFAQVTNMKGKSKVISSKHSVPDSTTSPAKTRTNDINIFARNRKLLVEK